VAQIIRPDDQEENIAAMQRDPFISGVVTVMLFASQLSAVDTVTRKSNGKKLGGTITGMSQTGFTVKKSVGESEAVQANDISAIEWDGASGDLRLGNIDETGGKYASALQRYTKSKAETKTPSNELRAEIDYSIARATARLALFDPDKQQEAIHTLLAIQKSSPNHVRYFESVGLLGQIQLARGDLASAKESFDIVAEAPWNEYKLLAKIFLARILVADKKLDDAIQEFAAAAATAATDSTIEQSRKYEALLGQSRTLIVMARCAEALNILEVITDNAPADDGPIQAEAYCLQGNALQTLGRGKEAALAYLHVDILFPQEADFHAEALFNLSKVWKLVQLPDRATDTEMKLVQKYPNSVWRKKLAETSPTN
jgi:tetratricopeptide (TPR) repeat protein